MVYNPLGRNTQQFIRLPVSTDKLNLTDSQGNALPTQVSVLVCNCIL